MKKKKRKKFTNAAFSYLIELTGEIEKAAAQRTINNNAITMGAQ
jgi:hypothetical protein